MFRGCVLMIHSLRYNQTLEGLKYSKGDTFEMPVKGYNQTLEGLKLSAPGCISFPPFFVIIRP
ncbi:hypothetical protein SAMN06295989_1026 [Methanohalophilus euhalobius]|uniref:Uncharacterized protein n=1 Tax=Methanohalophilus euhalobius TaxID=51203 RepID=A0A285EWK0_9EURY|nr:MAG: hypothetical protein A8273_1915 [Methanohalophilus sp. 2-GBenrich]SNY03430.1 hypothetical protein SAMN06295989_1026 [Methanohalophilus euhalobius]